MDEYVAIAQNLSQVAEYVQNGQLAIKDIPFESIMQMVSGVYNEKTGEGELFVELYTRLMMKGLEKGDGEEIVIALKLLARHMVVFASDMVKLDVVSDEKYRLQSRVGHLKNNEKIREWHIRNGDNVGTPFEGKGVVYTAVTGGYDSVREPLFVNPEWDYILFTDNPEIAVTSTVWQVHLIENKELLDDVRLARRVKILGHEYLSEYDYSIWIDGKIQIKEDLREYIERYRKQEPMLCFNHYISECVCHELQGCISLKKDNQVLMETQVNGYLEEGYPRYNGMIDSAVLVRDIKNERVKRVMETWWGEIVNKSRRDQLSFNYACWKNDFVYDTTDLYIYGNKYVQIHGHN